MRRCRKCYCTNPAACQACRSYYRGRVKNAFIIAFVMCVGAMLLGCILALLMIGVLVQSRVCYTRQRNQVRKGDVCHS